MQKEGERFFVWQGHSICASARNRLLNKSKWIVILLSSIITTPYHRGKA